MLIQMSTFEKNQTMVKSADIFLHFIIRELRYGASEAFCDWKTYLQVVISHTIMTSITGLLV